MGKPNEFDPSLFHVPPSQQSAQGPVAKPGELLVPKVHKAPEAPSKPVLVTPSYTAKE